MKKKYAGDSRIAETALVIVCHKDAASEGELRKRARKLGIDDHLRLTGFVRDVELVSLYQKARCLFFPSLYEGFGLPVLEGLACGLPIAASNNSSIPEVAGDLAVYFDPLNVESMAEALFAVMNAPVDSTSRRQRHEHARQFSWQRTALATLQAFSDSNHAPRPAQVAATASL
jgi:glycosyltransferase involved in cell wall biosynthesis